MNEERRGKKRMFHRLAVARSDIFAAWKTVGLLAEQVKEMGDPLYEPLFHAIVASYARPFKESKPYGPLPARWGRFADPRLQDAHDVLLRARDRHVAHSDAVVREVHVLPPGSTLGGFRTANLFLMVTTTWWPLENFKNVFDTCSDLGGRLDTEVERLLRDLYGQVDLPAKPFRVDPEDDL